MSAQKKGDLVLRKKMGKVGIIETELGLHPPKTQKPVGIIPTCVGIIPTRGGIIPTCDGIIPTCAGVIPTRDGIIPFFFGINPSQKYE